MKKATIILIAVFTVFCGKTFAQQKYGHINSTEVVKAMPEFKQMTAAVDKKKKDAQTTMEKMYADYQTKLKDLNQYGPSMMEAIREEKTRELDSLQRGLQGFEQKATAEIQDYQQKLVQPLNDKYLKVVSQVAKEGGYTYIFDLSSGTVAYYPEKDGDISDLVKKKLGIN